MEEIKKYLIIYKEKTKASNSDCGAILNLTIEQIEQIEAGNLELEESEKNRILAILQSKTRTTGKKVVKILDLFFRFVSTVMALVTLLLCINGYDNLKALITVLAISVVSSSMIMLPRNEK